MINGLIYLTLLISIFWLTSSTSHAETVVVEKIPAEKTEITETPEAKASPSITQDGDTYNFYFQKAPGPQTVQQGGRTDSPTPQKISDNQTQTTPKPMPVIHPDGNKIGILFGLEKLAAAEGSGAVLGGQFVFDGRWIAQGTFHYFQGATRKEHGVDFAGITNRETKSVGQGISLAGGYIPFRFGPISHRHFLSLLGGVTYLTLSKETKYHDVGSFGIRDETSASMTERLLMPFASLGFNMNFSENLGLIAQVRVSTASYSSLSLAGIYNF